MEAVAALSLAANVVQFVDFGSRFLSLARNIYHSTQENDLLYDLNQFGSELTTLQSVVRSLDTGGSNESSMNRLAVECHEFATRMEEALEPLKPLKIVETQKQRDANKTVKAFKMALRAIWKEDEIMSLQQKLDGLRSRLTLALLVVIR